MWNEEILEVMCGVEYIGKVGMVGEVEKGIEMEVWRRGEIGLEEKKEVERKMKEII